MASFYFSLCLGLPDVQRSDSRSSSGKKEPGQDGDSRPGSKRNSRTSRRGSRGSDASIDRDMPGTSGCRQNVERGLPDDDSFEVQEKKGQLDSIDSLENYIEKQVTLQKENREKSAIGELARIPSNIDAAPRVQLRIVTDATGNLDNDQSLMDNQKLGTSTRSRKMAVVTPPHSPGELKSPKEIFEPSGHLWSSSGNRTQLSCNMRDSTPSAMRAFTPVETIQIRPLPPIEGSGRSTGGPISRAPPSMFHRMSSARSTPPLPNLTNGLEGCCGGGPLVGIPPENRVTCAVEIHGQKSESSSPRDIHRHTETQL